MQDVGEQQGRQRHLLARLEHHAVVGGHAGHHLVRHLVHRVVERGDGGDHAQQRVTLGVHLALPAMRRDVAAEGLAVVLQHLQRAEHQHVGHAAGLVGAVLQAQAALGRDQRSDLGGAAAHGRGCLVQDVGALEAAQLRLVALGDGEGLPHLVERGLGHRAHQRPGERVVHGDVRGTASAHHLAGNAQVFVAGVRHGSAPVRRHRSCASGAGGRCRGWRGSGSAARAARWCRHGCAAALPAH